jgi:hypothetical protein
MVSCFGIQYLLNVLYVSHRLLQLHFFFIFFRSTFDVRRSMFDVRCSFLASYSIKLAASAAGDWAETLFLMT